MLFPCVFKSRGGCSDATLKLYISDSSTFRCGRDLCCSYLWPTEEHQQADGQPHREQVNDPEPRPLLRRCHQLSENPRLAHGKTEQQQGTSECETPVCKSHSQGDWERVLEDNAHLISAGHQFFQPPAV